MKRKGQISEEMKRNKEWRNCFIFFSLFSFQPKSDYMLENDNFAVICHWCHHIAFWIEKFTKKIEMKRDVLRCDNNLILFNGIIRTLRQSSPLTLSLLLTHTRTPSRALGMNFFIKLFCQTNGMHYSLVAGIGLFISISLPSNESWNSQYL